MVLKRQEKSMENKNSNLCELRRNPRASQYGNNKNTGDVKKNWLKKLIPKKRETNIFTQGFSMAFQ